LKNTKEIIKEFEKKYQQNIEDVRKQKKEETFRRKELPVRFIAKTLFGWPDKKYNEEYWGRLEKKLETMEGKMS